MRQFATLLAFLAFLVFASASQVTSHKGTTPQLREDVDLPKDFTVDFRLAEAERSSFCQGGATQISGQVNEVGEEVFRALTQNSRISSLSLPYRWRLSLVDSGTVNAYSRSDGEVSIERDLADLIGSDRGLWAAVLSHEIAHVARRHRVQEYLYTLYANRMIRHYEMRARFGDRSAKDAALALKVAAPLAGKKLSRTHENEADLQGMMLMAASGYHPDNVFALHHLLEAQTPDNSKFVTFFFQDHPRWATRGQRAERAYSGALAKYSQLWADPARSPGGQPPVVAFAGNPRSTTNKADGAADLELPLYCRNASEPLTLVIQFSKGKHRVQTSDARYRDAAGNMEVRQQIPCLDREDAAPLDVHLPASLVSDKDRKTQAQAFVMASSGEVLERFKSLEVFFPKSNFRASKAKSAPQTQTAVLQPRTTGMEDRVERGTTSQPLAVHPQDLVTRQEDPGQQPTERAISYGSSKRADATSSRKPVSAFGVTGSTDGINGVRIISVSPRSPAAKAGLVAGDIVVALDGTKVANAEVLSAESAAREPGSKVIATIVHASWTYNVTITTEDDVSASAHSFGLLFPGHTLKPSRQ
jgi:Zn-dependent protease with chaperone function